MSKLVKKKRGIQAIYRLRTVDAVVFGAVFHQKTISPEKSTREIIQNVIKTFDLEDSLEAVTQGYYRMFNAYLQSDDDNSD